MQEWAYERLIQRAEQYLKDAESAKKLGWMGCARKKIQNADFCLTLAEHIRLGIQRF